MSSIIPTKKRIVLVRHGESLGNVDKTAYEKIPDFALPLTDKGRSQASALGKTLKQKYLQDTTLEWNYKTIKFYVSSYHRAKETYEYLRSGMGEILGINYKYQEDPRIIEQEWTGQGVISSHIEKQKEDEKREKFGNFFFRFEGGESCLDAYQRVCQFCSETLFWSREDVSIVVSHGMTIRLMLMALLSLTVDQFEELSNPLNCEYFELEYDLSQNKIKLLGALPRRKAIEYKYKYQPKINSNYFNV